MGNSLEFSEDKFKPVPLNQIKMGKPRPFPLYIYLAKNNHLILLRKEDQELEESSLNRYHKMNVENFWCPNEFATEYEEYFKESDSPAQEVPAPEAVAEKEEADDEEFDGEDLADLARSEEAALAIDVLETDELEESQKQKVLSQISQDLISNLYDMVSEDPEESKEALKKCQEFAEDIVQVGLTTEPMQDLWSEIEDIQKEVGLEHSTSVSTFAVLFALGIGYTEPELLADLSMAGLLHDLGFVKLDFSLLSVPESEFSDQQKDEFRKHVELGLELIEEQKIEVPEEILEIIEQHHENFDGTGYPKGIKGFEINELSQLISIADHLDDLMTGRLDGKEMNPKEAMNQLTQIETDQQKTQRFDPDMFSRLQQLLSKSKDLAQKKNEADNYTEQAKAS